MTPIKPTVKVKALIKKIQKLKEKQKAKKPT